MSEDQTAGYPLCLGSGDRWVEPSILLSRSRPIIARPSSPSGEKALCENHFIRAVNGFHVIDDTSRELSSFTHKQRHVLHHQRRVWQDRNLHFRIELAEDMEEESLWNLFYLVVVPDLLKQGIHPYGIKSFPTFKSLISHNILILVENTAHLPMGLSVFSIGRVSNEPAKTETNRIAIGLVKAHTANLDNLTRWWMYLTLEAFAELNIHYLSYGSDNGLIDRKYMPVIADKVYWGSSRAFTSSQNSVYYSSGPDFRHMNDRFVVMSEDGTIIRKECSSWRIDTDVFQGYKLLPLMGSVQETSIRSVGGL